MEKYSDECIVLRAFNYKDADKIFSLLTKKKGRISVVAKGVRKFTSRRAGSLDTLNKIAVLIIKKSSHMGNIGEVRTIESYKDIKKSLEKSGRAYYCCELIQKNVEEEHDDKGYLFELLANTLKSLNTTENPDELDMIISIFEISFLNYLGYKMPDSANLLNKLDDKLVRHKIKAYLSSTLGTNIKTFSFQTW